MKKSLLFIAIASVTACSQYDNKTIAKQDKDDAVIILEEEKNSPAVDQFEYTGRPAVKLLTQEQLVSGVALKKEHYASAYP